jgi:hypothetical protein
MAHQSSDREMAEFIKQIRAANNLITEQHAIELYNVRDAVQALLALRPGERIIIDKSKEDIVF